MQIRKGQKVNPRYKKTQMILDKGEMITCRDIMYLQSRGVTISEIAEASKMKRSTFNAFYLEWRNEATKQGLI